MSSKLQLVGSHHKSVVAPSGECLRGKGRYGVICELLQKEHYINALTYDFLQLWFE